MTFEIAVMSTLLLFWTIVLRRFESETPRTKLLVRCVLGIGLGCLVSAYGGRNAFYGFVALIHLPFAYVHLWWLPKRGINGWTAEPWDEYRKIRGWTE